jgi:UDP-N-acetylmuramoyl-L-alanyl-D-glutamate--2,6-diaminopimelate ligase
VFNLDDSYGARMKVRCTGRTVGFSLNGHADVCIENVRISVEGLAFELLWQGKRLPFTSPMTGRYNVQNLAGVIILALESGIDAAAIRDAVANFSGAPGRLDRVAFDGGPAVFVDYAHSPDAMENVLGTLRQVCAGRKLTVVFGCGGDRDHTKRPQMGGIAARLADRVVITSDNPRTENPAAIIEQILAGVPRTDCVATCPDRREAIYTAIKNAAPGEVVAILGKGHEDYQIFSDRTVHFDDKEEALRALAANFGAPGRAAA